MAMGSVSDYHRESATVADASPVRSSMAAYASPVELLAGQMGHRERHQRIAERGEVMSSVPDCYREPPIEAAS
jgi:hypothetical protein